MKISRSIALSALFAGLALAAPLTIRDALGRSVTVNAPVKRVVALSLTTTEIMIDIGLNPIGRPSSATYPEAKVKSIPEVGSAYRPDIEKILALKPDLMLGSVGTTAAQARALGALSVPLIVTADSSLKDVYDNYTLIGQLTNSETQAKVGLQFLQSKIKRVIAKVPKTNHPKVLALLAAGGQSFSTTDETYIGDLLEKLGAINVAKGTPSADPRQPGFVVLSLEQIVASNPDVILAFRPRTATGAYAPSPLEKLETQPAYQNLNAVKNNRVHLLDADPFVTAPGPRAAESMNVLLGLLYPKK